MKNKILDVLILGIGAAVLASLLVLLGFGMNKGYDNYLNSWELAPQSEELSIESISLGENKIYIKTNDQQYNVRAFNVSEEGSFVRLKKREKMGFWKWFTFRLTDLDEIYEVSVYLDL